MSFTRFATTTLLLFQTSLALSAAVIYDGGAPDGVNGANLSARVSAQSFTLASAAALQGLIFLGSADVDDVPSRFSGTIGFRFLSNNAGAPGTSLALGSDSSVQLVDNRTKNLGTDEYRFLVNLGSIPLAAGTYWLALHEGTMGTAFDATTIYWDTTSSAPAGAATWQTTTDLGGLSGYSSEAFKLSFQLLDAPAYNAVPEPSTWVLMLSAGGFLLLLRRRSVVAWARGVQGGPAVAAITIEELSPNLDTRLDS
jgi:hypothetical protein